MVGTKSRLTVGALAWLAAACAGRSIDRGAGPATTPGGSAGTFNATSGASSVGGSYGGVSASGGSAGGSSGDSGECTDASLPNVLCVPSCGDTSVVEYIYATCVDGSWLCPGMLTSVDKCAPDACIRQDRSCCDPVYGNQSNAPCGANGLFADCPAGTTLTRPMGCFPQSAGTTACTTLANKNCTVNGANCGSIDGVCSCGAADGGALVWTCAFNI